MTPSLSLKAAWLEPGYQVARLRLLCGLTRDQLTEMVGSSPESIIRLENGNSVPSLSFLERITGALDATVEIKIKPKPLSS